MSGRFTTGKEPRYPLNRGQGGARSRSGRFGGEKNLLLLRDFEPRLSIPISSFVYENFLFVIIIIIIIIRFLRNMVHSSHHKGLERKGLKNDPESLVTLVLQLKQCQYLTFNPYTANVENMVSS